MGEWLNEALAWAAPVLLIPWLSAAVAVLGALLGLGADALARERLGVRVVGLGLLGASIASLGYAALPAEAGGGIQEVYGIAFVGVGFAGLAAVVYLGGALACLSGLASVPTGRRAGVAGLIGLSAAASQVLLSASDIVVLLLALEVVAVAGYALVASAATRFAHEAAMRYFVQGSVATGLLVFAVAVLAGTHGGITELFGLSTALQSDTLRLGAMGVLLLITGLAFKSGAFPFHSWVPDAYETAPAAAAAFLGAGPKAAALGSLVVVSAAVTSARMTEMASAFEVIALGSLILGTFGALKQTSVARMLGYSAIAQVGYAFIGLATEPGTAGLFAACYALGVTTAFLVLEVVRLRRPEWDGSIGGLAGLSSESPGLALALSVAMFSLTGIPLSAGFVGKLFVFVGAVEADLTWLAVVGALASVVSFGYYGSVVRAAYFGGSSQAIGERSAGASGLPAFVGAAAIVALGTLPLLGFAGLLRIFGV